MRERIYDYRLPPGEWIDEPALCEELGISRTPLREALKLLAAEGLVQIDAGRGSRVTRLTLEDLNQLFPVMAMLEGRCAHEAVRHIDDAGVQQLEALHAAMEAAAAEGNIAEYYRNNYLIHETVQHYAGNPWLIRITHDLHRILKMHRGRQLLTRAHRAIAGRAPRADGVLPSPRRAGRRTHHGTPPAQPGPGLGRLCGGRRAAEPAPLPTEGGG